ncbi:hypothetical protein [Criblamydia sequanensis]|uniref:Conserved putative secreted protein n=1 Tax=Candidatus Criblamydia sequanensis CRIB-18 TaxID=1437425 RepID=A0A090D1Q9_9BACT|nr:hypothetical protein [Criblamydia sequanensis]CDR33678.1 Conserved putative secreted protein [Criblamydia sequanensis CRIB-18]
MYLLLILSLFIFNPISTQAIESIDLSKFEKKVFSQNGEDGVIEKIFNEIGVSNCYYVEFGVENGLECNTRYLREKKNWKGLLMDGGYANPAINLKKEFITRENIANLFAKYKVPSEFDLLSIDIDYNDFYVWNALRDYRPRVVVIEYNSTHLPNEDKIVVYNANGRWDGTNYFGASILSLTRLAKKKGYTLVYANNNGVNLFFVRDDLLKKASFKDAGNINSIYRPPTYGHGPNGGHAADPKKRPFVSSVSIIGKVPL